MNTPTYSQVPLSDSQTTQLSRLLPPQQDEKKKLSSDTEEPEISPRGLLMAATPQTGFERVKFRLKTISHKYWLLEAAATSFSLIFLVVIIGVLKYYDNRYYGDSSTKNPNQRPMLFPVLAILGALMRATMLLPVATAIGQLKWGWFRNGRRLLDMERFDEAARGILGSTKLIWTLRFRSVAAVGAALTILALPLDAVIQSAVLLTSTLRENQLVYPQYPNITDKTWMPRSTWYTKSQVMTNASEPWPVTPMLNAIRWGYSYDTGLADLFEAVTRVNCPTGYCTFNKSQTLAVGSTCVDRTAQIQTFPLDREKNVAAYQTLPSTNLIFSYDGFDVDNETYQRQIIAAESWNTWPEPQYKGVTFNDSLGPIIVRTPMLVNWFSNSTYRAEEVAAQTVAFECALYWYVHTATAFVNENSSYKLDFTDESVLFDITRGTEGSENRWLLEPHQCFVEGREILTHDGIFYEDNCKFVVGETAAAALENMAFDSIDGLQGTSFLKNGVQNEWTRTNNFITNLYATGETEMDNMTDKNDLSWRMVNTMWSNIAYGMSYTVQRTESRMIEQDDVQLKTTGTVWQPIYYWSIDWPRLAAPAFVVVFAAFFVLYTAIITRKEYSWRRSALPLLFHGLEDGERAALGDVRSFITMQDVAARLHVRLDEHVDANGVRFTAQH